MEEKQEGAPAPTVQSVTTGAPDAPTLVVGPSDGAGGVSLPSGDTPWGSMGPLGDRLYAPELLRNALSAAVDVWRTVSCGNHSAPLGPLLNSVGALVRLGLLPGRSESEPRDLVVIPKTELDALRSAASWSKLGKADLARVMEERESFRKQAEQLAAELAGLLPEPVRYHVARAEGQAATSIDLSDAMAREGVPPARTIGFRELAEQRMERIMALHEALAKVYAAARPDLDDDSTDALDAVRHMKDDELGAFADELCEWLTSSTFETAFGAHRAQGNDLETSDALAVQADRARAYEVLCMRLGFTQGTTDPARVCASAGREPWPVERVIERVRDIERELQAERVRADAAVERGKRWRDEVLHAQEQVAGARADAESARAQEHNAKYTRRRFIEMFADVLAEVFSATEPSRSSEGLFDALMGTLEPRVEVVGPALEALRLERKTSREFAREALHRESSVRARLCTVVDESFGPFPPMSRLSLDDLVSFVERALQVARREPDLMTEACEKLWRATAGRVTPRIVVDTADGDEA